MFVTHAHNVLGTSIRYYTGARELFPTGKGIA